MGLGSVTNSVRWSDNLERIHGLPPGTFDGTFASYEREIHPDDRERVLASVQRALAEGVPHEVEYRIVAPDGTVRWCEGKGRVEYQRRPAGAHDRRLHDGHAAQGSGARAARGGGRSEPPEGRIPRHAVARAADTAERHPRLGADAAERRPVAPSALRQAIDVIGRNARLQAQLIDDILDVSRIITGKLEIERAPVAIAAADRDRRAGVAPAAAARQIRSASRSRRRSADRRRSEAPAPGPQQRAVERGEVHARRAAASTWLRGRDRDRFTSRSATPASASRRSSCRLCSIGSGRPTAVRRAGTAVSGSDSRSPSISSTQHGGEIQAFSDGPGRGTSILIQLPADSHGAPGAPHGSEGRVTGRQLQGTTALVVDDQADARELVAALLEQHGAQVIQSDSAASALEVIASRAVQVLIADIAMPEVDGYALIEHLRARGFDAPAIAVTAYARPEDRQHAMASGYSGYCAKPVDAAQLVSLVRTAVSTTGQSLPQN